MKKKFLSILTAWFFLVGMAGVANATTFTLQDYTVIESISAVSTIDKLTTPLSTDLTVGNSYSIDLFEISSTAGTYLGAISVLFDWVAPDNMSDSVTGIAGGIVSSSLNGAGVIWDGVTDFYFGNGGHFTVGLSDVFYAFSNSATVVAELNFISDSAPVPEPATMLLFGTGIAALAGTGIRRKKKK